MNTLESYILKKIKDIDEKINGMIKSDYTEQDYTILIHRLSGQKSILYQCLTAHDNTYQSK